MAIPSISPGTEKTISSDTEVVAGTAIIITNDVQKIYGTGGVILTATPSVVAGTNGQTVVFQGTSNINTVTFQDETNLTDCDLRLSGNVDVTLGLYDTLELMYDGTVDKWIELSRSIN